MKPIAPGDTAVVLGAGLAGLSAADTLASRGVRVVVLEKSPCVGGLAATRRKEGFRFDLGPHRFHTKNAALMERMRSLVGGDLLELERLSRIRLLDRYFLYPLSLGDVLRRMPLHRGAAMLASYAATRLRVAAGGSRDDSFESWVVNRFGRALYDVYFGPYTAKLWGMDPKDLSPDWASQRISVPDLWGLVKETISPGEDRARSLVSLFSYPRGGIGRIADALACRVRAAGGYVLLSTEPGSITRTERGFSIGTSGGAIEASGIVNTIPVTEYAALMGDLLPQQAVEASRSLRFRAIVYVVLKVARRPAARDHWIYTPEDWYGFNRLSIAENFDPEASPSGAQVVFEYTCGEGDPVWRGEGDLAVECAEGGARLGLFERGDVLGSTVERQLHAYPVYAHGYAEASGAVLDALDGLPGSVTCGRQGLFRYNNMDHSMEMGELAALELLGEGSVRERFDWSTGTWADG